MPVQIQKVAYCEHKGVFLGVRNQKILWSKDPSMTGDELAPTFQDRADLGRYLKKEFEGQGAQPDGIDTVDLATCDLREVWPRREGGQVGVEEIANSGLPRWGNK